MADAFYGIGEDGCARSGLTVCEDNIFVEEGALSECGLIEHIAQSAALRAGYMDRSRGEKVRLGYIGAVNDLKVHALPPVGSRLVTTIAVEPVSYTHLVKRFGRIVNIVSLSGIKGLPGQTNYSAAKGGVIAATKALAQEVAKKGVTVNAVSYTHLSRSRRTVCPIR